MTTFQISLLLENILCTYLKHSQHKKQTKNKKKEYFCSHKFSVNGKMINSFLKNICNENFSFKSADHTISKAKKLNWWNKSDMPAHI